MKEESINELRRMLIEYVLTSGNKKLSADDVLEAAIWLHNMYQPDTYEENRKALQKVLDRKNYR